MSQGWNEGNNIHLPDALDEWRQIFLTNDTLNWGNNLLNSFFITPLRETPQFRLSTIDRVVSGQPRWVLAEIRKDQVRLWQVRLTRLCWQAATRYVHFPCDLSWVLKVCFLWRGELQCFPLNDGAKNAYLHPLRCMSGPLCSNGQRCVWLPRP